MKSTQLFNEFFKSEKAGGIILILCTGLSILISNSFLQNSYLNVWQYKIAGMSIEHLINDGLMSIFFLLIGLELEREIKNGELSNFKSASLPVFAALGGMVVPACFFLLFNFNTETQVGAGIPMATDIAFAVGVLSLLGSRVPVALKIFLVALAVIDDLGAILVIAIFYTEYIALTSLFITIGIFLFLLLLNKLKIHSLVPYIILGIVMWYFMLQSGVHPTVTGVLLAFAIPFGDGYEKAPSYKLQHFLQKPVAFIILPLFALANTAIAIDGSWYKGLAASNSLGILTGLIIGKPLGIFMVSFLFVGLGMCTLPAGLRWTHILGAGFLGGIGFTMSIFISLIAFTAPELIIQSKIAILISSVISGLLGYFWLRKSLIK